MTLRPFHLAFPVHDLAAARAFYAGVLGCTEGRAGVAVGIARHVRVDSLPGEQATMFFRDPGGNAPEFKAFADHAMLFATEMTA